MKTYRFASPSLKRAALPEKSGPPLCSLLWVQVNCQPLAPRGRAIGARATPYMWGKHNPRTHPILHLLFSVQVVRTLLMPRKFRMGRLDKSGTGNNKRKAAARLIVRPGERRALQQLQDEGEIGAAGVSPNAFVREVRRGLVHCHSASHARRGGASWVNVV